MTVLLELSVLFGTVIALYKSKFKQGEKVMETIKKAFSNIGSKIFNIMDEVPGAVSSLILLIVFIPFFS